MILIPVKLLLLQKKNESDIDFHVIDSLSYEDLTNVHGILLDEFDKFKSSKTYLNLDYYGKCSFDKKEDSISEHKKRVIANIDQIGLFEECPSHLQYSFDYKTCFDLISEIGRPMVKKIIEKGGICNVLCVDEFSEPKEYEDIGLWDGEPRLLLKNKKVIVYS